MISLELLDYQSLQSYHVDRRQSLRLADDRHEARWKLELDYNAVLLFLLRFFFRDESKLFWWLTNSFFFLFYICIYLPISSRLALEKERIHCGEIYY